MLKPTEYKMIKHEHGGNLAKIAREHHITLSDLTDFSANINPLGIPETVKMKIGEWLEHSIHYPDVDYIVARTSIAEFENCATENVLLSNGAAQAFFEIAQHLQPKKLLILAPTFAEYRQAFAPYVTEIIEHTLNQQDNYSWQVDDILQSMEQLSAGDTVLLCNPNNPTGTLVENSSLQQIADYTKCKKIHFIIDEAFIDFVSEKERYSFVPFLKDYPHVIVVKSMTKFFAVPGLRLGYALSYHVALFERIMQTRVPWSVNTLAAQSVPALLNDLAYHTQTKQWLNVEQEWLYQQLQQFPQLNIVPPSVNYIFFECLKDIDLKTELLKKRIVVRSCQNYSGLTKRHYRVAIKNRADNQKLLTALNEIL